MNKTYYRLRHMSRGQKIFWSWTLFWFLLALPVALLWNGTHKGSTPIGDLLFLSVITWMLASTVGSVLWLIVKGTIESMMPKPDPIYVLED
jgi:RsiW-degrading membrane proteinase PrsW (M82 family)